MTRGWRRWKTRMAYRREKKRKTQEAASPEFAGFCLLAISFLGLYCSVFPHHAGMAGAYTTRALSRAFGQCQYLLWFLIGYRGFRLILNREDRRPWRYLLVDLLLLAAACCLVSSFGGIFLGLNPGGYLGKISDATLSQLFGRGGAFFIAGFVLAALILWRSGTRPRQAMAWIEARLAADWKEWREAVSVQKSRSAQPPERKPLPKVMPAKPLALDKSVLALQPELRAFPPPSPKVSLPPVFEPVSSARAAAKPLPASRAVAALNEEESPAPPFRNPPLELLTAGERFPAMAKEEDLLVSAQHLEKTLAEFGVQGKVVEIHPGPIITRFDYTPAPGIKVQAVANLSNDIALAMKALSVRILAPIPGKSAVGIELPNVKRAI